MMLIIEYMMIHLIFDSKNELYLFFRLSWMLLRLLNTHANVTGAIVHVTKHLTFLLNFLTQ